MSEEIAIEETEVTETAIAIPLTVADLASEVEQEVTEEISKIQRKKLKQMIKEIKGLEALLEQRRAQLEDFKKQPLMLNESNVFELEG